MKSPDDRARTSGEAPRTDLRPARASVFTRGGRTSNVDRRGRSAGCGFTDPGGFEYRSSTPGMFRTGPPPPTNHGRASGESSCTRRGGATETGERTNRLLPRMCWGSEHRTGSPTGRGFFRSADRVSPFAGCCCAANGRRSITSCIQVGSLDDVMRAPQQRACDGGVELRDDLLRHAAFPGSIGVYPGKTRPAGFAVEFCVGHPPARTTTPTGAAHSARPLPRHATVWLAPLAKPVWRPGSWLSPSVHADDSPGASDAVPSQATESGPSSQSAPRSGPIADSSTEDSDDRAHGIPLIGGRMMAPRHRRR